MTLIQEFQLDNSLCYLNHAGVSPWPKRTVDAIHRFAQENNRLGAAQYPHWMQQETLLRRQFQSLLNAQSADEIALVKNTSEALSIVAYGVRWQDGDNIVISEEEFPSNRVVWQSLKSLGVQTRIVRFADYQQPELQLIQACDKRTRLLSVSSVQYASGLRMNLESLGNHCKQQNILFCVDAIQSVGALVFDVQAIHADFAMADGHKWMLAPEGLGFFYCRDELRSSLKLQQFGWHMLEHAGDYDRTDWQPATGPRRFECGSPNMLGIHALSASLSLLHDTGMEHVQTKVLENARYIMECVDERDHLVLITPTPAERHAGIVTFKHTRLDGNVLYQALMQRNVICAHRAGGVRFSPHFYTPKEVIDRAMDIIDSL